MANTTIFRITFQGPGTIYEIYAKKLVQSNLFGFVEVEQFIFNTKTKMLVDPGEERLKNEFADTKRTYIPMHQVLRIDEVKKQGVAKVHELTGEKTNVSQFPNPIYTKTE